MSPINLHNLAPEVQLIITRYIRRLSDLASICLVSRALNSATTPTLYDCVVLDLDNCTLSNLNGFFLPTHPERYGHVKVLCFRPGLPKDCDDAIEVMRLAIQMLPRNGLREIRLPYEMPADHAFLLSLCMNQRQLSHLSEGPDSVCADWQQIMSSKAFPQGCFDNLECLVIPKLMSKSDDLHGYNRILRCAKRLRILSICRVEFEDETTEAEQDDDVNEDGLIVRTLFEHVPPHGDGSRLELSRFSIWGLDMTHSDQTWEQVIEFSKLTKLEVKYCADSSSLLKSLTTVFSKEGAALRNFSYWGDELENSVIQNFLRSLTGLCSLSLSYFESESDDQSGIDHSFDMSCLKQHGPTLRQLGIALSERAPRFQPPPVLSAEVDLLLQNCRQLRELALGLPSVHMTNGVNGNLGDFGASIRKLCEMPQIKALQISNWPIPPAGTYVNIAEEVAEPEEDSDQIVAMTAKHMQRVAQVDTVSYLKQLDSVASAVFQFIGLQLGKTAPSMLPMLCFGRKEPAYVFEESSNRRHQLGQVYYVPTLQYDQFGRSKFVAVRISRSMAEECLLWDNGDVIGSL